MHFRCVSLSLILLNPLYPLTVFNKHHFHCLNCTSTLTSMRMHGNCHYFKNLEVLLFYYWSVVLYFVTNLCLPISDYPILFMLQEVKTGLGWMATSLKFSHSCLYFLCGGTPCSIYQQHFHSILLFPTVNMEPLEIIS